MTKLIDIAKFICSRCGEEIEIKDVLTIDWGYGKERICPKCVKGDKCSYSTKTLQENGHI